MSELEISAPVGNKVRKYKHFTLTVILLSALFFHPLLPRSWGGIIFLVVFTSSVWLVGGRARATHITFTVLAVPLLILVLAATLYPQGTLWQTVKHTYLQFVMYFMIILFLVYCAGVIFGALARARRITVDEVVGCVNLYVMLGFIWAFLYTTLQTAVPESFNVGLQSGLSAADLNEARGPTGRFVYFSFITLATQGYGDITPQNSMAEMMVVAETIVGQFYVAVVVTYFLSVYITQHSAAEVLKGRADEVEEPRPDSRRE